MDNIYLKKNKTLTFSVALNSQLLLEWQVKAMAKIKFAKLHLMY